MGVFILALLEDCEINQRLLMESPTRRQEHPKQSRSVTDSLTCKREWAQESFGHIVLSEPSYVLKYISGCVIREMVAHGFPAQGFWPHYTNPELTQKFPKSMVENTQWVKSVIEYIQENDTQSLNPHKT